MRLKLTVDVPHNVDRDEFLTMMLGVRLTGEGMTVTTADGTSFDVDLVDIERVGVVKEMFG